MGVFETLQNGGNTSASSGGVFARLNQPSPEELARQKTNYDNGALSQAYGNNLQFQTQPAPQPVQTETTETIADYKNDPSRKIPIVGPILRGLDAFATNPIVDKAAEIGRDFYVPGAGLANVAGLAGAAETGVSKLLPGLAGSTAGRVAQKAATEAIVGVPIGVGQSLQTNPDESVGQAAEQGLFGGALGAAGGVFGKLAGSAVGTLADKYAGTKVGNALGKITGRVQENAPDATLPEVKQEQPTVAETPETTNVPVDTVPNERGLFRTLRESGKLSDETATALENSPDRTYAPITNQDTVNAANEQIAKGLDNAESFALSGTKSLNPEQVATGFRLIDEYQKSGQIDKAVNMAEHLSKRLTEAGQTVQAASIWNRLTPEGALVAAQRKVAQINQEASKLAKPVEVTEKNAADIMDAAAAIQRSGQSQERASQVMDIMDRLRSGHEVSQSEKQTVADFIKDAEQFVKPPKARIPREARPPKEMTEPRVRDRVVNFLDTQEQAARERLKARGITLSSLPLDVYADYALIGAAKLGKGVVKFADWSEQMVKDLGEGIRPHLVTIYEKAQDMLSSSAKRISQETISGAEKIATNYIRKNEAKLQPDDIDLIRNMAKQVSDLSGSQKQAASQDLQAILNSFERAGLGRKISAFNYIFMLLNPLTQIKNIVGNELMYRLERLARIAATPADIVASKATGKPRQITFKSGPTVWDNFFQPTKDYFRGLGIGAKAGARGVNPEGLTTAYDLNGQAFRSKLNPLTYLEKTLGAVMKGFDYAAYNRSVQQRLREMAYLDALNKGIKGRDNISLHIDRYMSNLDDNIAAAAKEYGKYVTLQDSTLLSQRVIQFSKRCK